MLIKKIVIENYRGIQKEQEVPLSNFSSIVGKNDSGKSIILNAIASFLDPKNYPITESDFNNSLSEIVITCHFESETLREALESKVKSKVKKRDGLDEFLDDFLFEDSIIFRKKVAKAKKGFDVEEILIKDFEDEKFSLLYLKSDEELSTLVDEYSIIVPVAGTGRNSKLEKIKHIKKYCIEQGKTVIDKFIQDTFKISSLFPGVELFVSDYGLKADTSFKTSSVSELQEYFDEETSDDNAKLSLVAKEIEEKMQTEAQLIKKYMDEYVASLEEVQIKPSIVWKDAIKGVDVNLQFQGDQKLIPMSHKGTGYRRLFMVARFRYLAEKNKGNNIVYLIEEPETFLHPSAQEDLLNAFRDLSENNQIIVTTHSPIFAGAANIESLILCKKDNQSIYEHSNDVNRGEFIGTIAKELGIKPSFNLRDSHEKILFVESQNDAKFYNIISQAVLNISLIDNPKVLVLPGGGDCIESFVNIDYFSNSQRDLFLIIDSDKHNEKKIEERQKQKICDFNTKPKAKGYLLKKSCIENYYHPRAIERVYNLNNKIFPFFKDDDNARAIIKQKVQENSLENKQIKEKNNIPVFEAMTKDEWDEVLEQEIKDFLKNIIE